MPIAEAVKVVNEVAPAIFKTPVVPCVKELLPAKDVDTVSVPLFVDAAFNVNVLAEKLVPDPTVTAPANVILSTAVALAVPDKVNAPPMVVPAEKVFTPEPDKVRLL